MKRTERHHLKENEVASTVARAKEAYELYRKPIIAAAIAVTIIVASAVGFMAWRSQADSQARALLADAMAVERAQVATAPASGATAPAPPPAGSYPTERVRNEAALAKFMAVANAYPSSGAGVAARYHAAAMLTALGRTNEAMQRYQEVLDRGGSSLYGQMAKLGMADAEVAVGKFDQAIAVYREMSSAKEGQLPVDGILMQLARAYGAAGKQTDARQTFKRVVDEFPQSAYSVEAKRAMDQITANP
jgi:TolA-binding protein